VRSKKAISIAVLAFAAAGLGWVGVRKFGPSGDAADAIARAERALAAPGMIALARIDVPALSEMLAKTDDTEAARPLDFDGELLAPLGLRGVALAAHASTALLAVSSAEELRVSAVLFGAFDPAALERAIQTANPQARAVDESGGRTLYLARLDPESCAETAWGIALRPERVVIRNERSLAPLLAELGDPDPPRSGWRAHLERRQPLATLTFTPAAPLAQASAHPLARALLRGGQRAFPGVESALLGIDRKALRGGLQVEMELSARDAAAAAALASAWEQARAEAADWKDIAPALAAWLEALRVTTDGARVRASAERDAEAVRELRELPATVVLAASRDLGDAAQGGATDQVEPWPTVFLESFRLGKLPVYGAVRATSEPADAVAGPFGVRLERAARGAADAPLELTLRAYGPLIPNLPADHAPRFSVERVLDKDGKALLREERCGRDRNTLASRLRRESVFERTEAEKKLRLHAGARLADVDRIEGHIELDLPERIQTVRAREPHAGQRLEVAGGNVEITSVTATSFSYRVLGEPRLVHIRGLNADRAALAAVEAWESDLPFGEGRLGARRFAGALASLEAIFALDVRHASYPFALASGRPGTDGASLDVESSEFIHYSVEQYTKEFGTFRGYAWPVDRTPLGSASAGPFTVGVTSLASGATLVPQLTVLAPPVPNLTYNATALELALSEVAFLEGRPLRPAGARALLQVHHRYGRSYLEGVASFDTGAPRSGPLQHVSGELSLKLPHEVESASFAELEPGSTLVRGDVSFALAELSRDSFTLRMSGPLDRFFSAQAFGEDGKELSVEPVAIPLADGSGSRELRFRVQGQPRRVAIQLVRGYTTQRYAFRIPLGEAVPAAPADNRPSP
jgi:hypothetical protein